MTRMVLSLARVSTPAFLFWLVLGLMPAADAHAVVTPHLRAELLSEVAAVRAGTPFWVALHFTLIPGWHTYWQNPGDSGAAPTIAWALPPGFHASAIHWPYPQRIAVGPLMNFGYSGEAWMLVRIAPPPRLAAIPPVTLSARADWLVCAEECVPESGIFTLTLPIAMQGAPPLSAQARAIDQARRRLPQPMPWKNSLRIASATLDVRISLGIEADRIAQAWFFPTSYGIVEHAAAQPITRAGDALGLKLTRGDLRSQPLERLQGVLILTQALPDRRITQAFILDISPGAMQAPGGMTLAMALLLALVGGLLLNVMPCVFPVLSMKAWAIAQQAHQTPREVRLSGVAFTAGVLVSFLALAVLLLMLRAMGEAVGWGFQLQSAPIVLVLAWLMFALGLMLSGVWSFGGALMGMGEGLTSRAGHVGSFFTGALSVVVATPCTAPFMGAALGFALAQPAVIALLVFLALGLGLAAPWLALSLWPGVGKVLPAPGAWLERLKQLLALPLYATSAWLIWVLAQQTGNTGVVIALGGMALIGSAAWLGQVPCLAQCGWRWLGAGVAVITLALLTAALGMLPTGESGQASAPAVNGERFSSSRLAILRAAGQPVLVNFTAAWCITCLVNERIALRSVRVAQAMQALHIVYLKGDWTRRDPEITQVLERHGHTGVPLYLLYPRGSGDPEVLPQVLTEGLVLDKLQRLKP